MSAQRAHRGGLDVWLHRDASARSSARAKLGISLDVARDNPTERWATSSRFALFSQLPRRPQPLQSRPRKLFLKAWCNVAINRRAATDRRPRPQTTLAAAR